MKQTIYLSNGEVYEAEYVQTPPIENQPTPVPKPSRGWFLYAGDGQRACRLKDDLHNPATNYQSRTLTDEVKIAITGMTYPWWSLIDGKVNEYKTITRLDRKRVWCVAWEYFLGYTNWVWICQPGNGEMDGNDKDTNPYVDPLKLQSIDYGNNLRRIVQNSSLAPRWTQVDVLKFDNPPVLIGDVWNIYIDNEWLELSWENCPQYFLSRTQCGHTSDKISFGPIVDKGYPGGTGDVKHPAVMSYDAILPTSGLDFYEVPFRTKIYAQSLLIDGNFNPNVGEGIDVTVDALCFSGDKTFGKVTNYASFFDEILSKIPFIGKFARISSENWYILDEMLVRGNIENPSDYGTWRDRRCYSDWLLNHIGCLTPTIGWIRGVGNTTLI